MSSGELPALVEIGEDNSFLGKSASTASSTEQTTRLVNYRFVEHRFEVDKVLTNARLTAGVGGGASDGDDRQNQGGLTMPSISAPGLGRAAPRASAAAPAIPIQEVKP